MPDRRDELTEALQAAIDAARDLGMAARASVGPMKLDQLAGELIQKTGAFRAALKIGVVHMRTQLPELGYDGPACLDEGGGEVTNDYRRVTCDRCQADMDRPIEKPRGG